MLIARFLLISALLLLPAADVLAADGVFDCRRPVPAETARKMVSEVERKYASVDTMQARFSQRSYLAALDASETSEGTVYFTKPGRMRWEYVAPEKQLFVVRGTDVWFYQPELGQVIVDSVSEFVLSEVPTSFLMGLGSIERDFVLGSACESAGGTVLDLTPARAAAQGGSLEKLRLLVAPGTSFPSGAQVTDVAGNTTTIVFGGMKELEKAPQNAYDLEFPAGTDVIDRRSGNS